MTHHKPAESTRDVSGIPENIGIGEVTIVEDSRADLEMLASPEASPESPVERFKGQVTEMLHKNFGGGAIVANELRDTALSELNRLFLEFAGSMPLAETAVLKAIKIRIERAVQLGLPITAEPHIVYHAHCMIEMDRLRREDKPGTDYQVLVGKARQVAYGPTVERLVSLGRMKNGPISDRKIAELISNNSSDLLTMEINEQERVLRDQAARNSLDFDQSTYADLDKVLYPGH